MLKFSFFLLILTVFGVGLRANDSLVIFSPLSRIVYQRDLNNKAVVRIAGRCPVKSNLVQARLVARSKGQGRTTLWTRISFDPASGTFGGNITAQAGWYDLQVCARYPGRNKLITTLERVGIGEVFVIVGHSVAQGGEINIEGSEDDRVITVPLEVKGAQHLQYEKTGDTADLPYPGFVKAASGIAPAPFGGNSYFWSKFAEYVAKKTNVPVLFYNAAFGGTSLEHWAKSAHGIQFEHGFVRSGIRMPYINLYNTLTKYIPLTGVRAILADQGQNDNSQPSADTIFNNYKIFVEQARADLRYPQLTVVVNRQHPPHAPQVRVAQEKMLREPFTFPGPDYDKSLVKEDRYDGIHLSEPGLRRAAVIWADALTPEFFTSVKPWIPAVK